MAKRSSVPPPDADDPIDALSTASCRLTVALKLLTDHECADSTDDTSEGYDGGAGIGVARDLVEEVRDLLRASLLAAQKGGA